MWILLAVACVHSPGGTMQKTGGLTTHLEVGQGTELSFDVENPGPKAATFCTYHTPFEGIRNNIFVVTHQGVELDYQGMMAKRAPPGKDDYRTLAPGESTGPVTVDLARAYELASGTYTVRYRGTGIAGLSDSNEVELVVP